MSSYRKYDGTAAAQTTAPVSDKFGVDAVETLAGSSAHESFWLGQGDTGVGGAGDDTYYLQGHKTTVVEAANGGLDKIVAWSNVDLSDYANIENVSVGNDGTYAAGNAFDNVVEGQSGAQQLYGGKGQDVLIGGAGKDVFIVVKGEGNDVIHDFSATDDKVRLKAGLSSFEQVKARMTQDGTDVRLDLGAGDGLVFRNITVDQFSAKNFQLELNANTLGGQTFADEFSGPLSIWDAQSNPTGTWRPDFGYQGEQGTGSYTLMSNDEKQIYTSPYFRGHNGDFSESPFVTNADGTLSIWARPSANGEIFGYGYTSGMITTKESHSQTYGYFEMRADIPDATGAWPAFWLIPTDGSWPPELDIMETLTSDPNALWTTQHSKASGSHAANGQLSFVPDTADGFHTYGALWSPTEIVWYVDNVEVFRTATPADMNKPMFMIANLALGGWGGAIDGGDLPAEFKIDYIRAWNLGDASAPPIDRQTGELASAAVNILRKPGNGFGSLSEIVDAADATTSVATLSYQFFTGATPNEAGLNYLVSPSGPNPNNLNSAYYQHFNLENRYINFAVNLGNKGEGREAFAAAYGDLGLEAATRKAYEEIFGATVDTGKIAALLGSGRDLYFEAYGQDERDGLGTKAAMIGWLLAEAVKGDIGPYALANEAFLVDLADGAASSYALVGLGSALQADA